MSKRLVSILIMCAMIMTLLGLTTVPASAASASKYVALQQSWNGVIKQKVGDYYIWIDSGSDTKRVRAAKTLSATPKTVATASGVKGLDKNVITNGYTIYYAIHNHDDSASATIYKTNVKKSYTKKLATIKEFDYLAGYYDGKLYYCTGDHKEGNKFYRMDVSTKLKKRLSKNLNIEASQGNNFVAFDNNNFYYYNVANGTKTVIPDYEYYKVNGNKIYAWEYSEIYDAEEDEEITDGLVIKELSFDGTVTREVKKIDLSEYRMIYFGHNDAYFSNSKDLKYKLNYKDGTFTRYITKLDQVKGVSAVSSNHNTVSVKWQSVANAKSYQVYRATSKSGTYKLIKTTSSLSYKNTSLKTGKTYYYKVRAKGTDVYGSFSSADPATPKLNTVKNVTATGGVTAITIKWDAVTGAKGYQVYRATSKSGKYTKLTSVKGTKLTNTSVTMNKTYYYKVRAYKVVDDSTKYGYFSSVVSAKAGSLDAIRAEMLRQVNAKRKAAGAEPLELYTPINTTAQVKAKDLYITGEFDHYSDNLGYFYDQYEEAGIYYYAGGENIAYANSSVTTVMNLWMDSPGHKANILNKNYTHLGVGYYKGYWVQQFIGQ